MTDPQIPDDPRATPDAPAPSGRRHRLGALGRRVGRMTRRALAVTTVVAVVVVAAATTIGLEVSRAFSTPAPPTTSTTTTASPTTTTQAPTGPPATAPTTTTTVAPGGATGTTPTSTTVPSGTGPPQLPTPGGATRDHGAYNALACTSDSHCVAVGADDQGNGVVAATTNAGSTWTTQTLPTGTATLDAVTCNTATHCVAVGQGAVLTTADGGKDWAEHTPPSDTTLLGVACVTAKVCLTAGVAPTPAGPYAGVVLRSTDGGDSWTPVTMPENTPGLGAVTCPTATRCIAVGAAIMVSDDGGTTWKVGSVKGGIQALLSVSCSTATRCIAVGPNTEGAYDPTVPGQEIETTDGGKTWSPVTLPAGTAAVDQVSCPGTTRCFAGGPHAKATKGAAFMTTGDGGKTWQTAPPPGGVSAIAGLSCPTSNACVMVGRSGTQPVTASSANPTTANAPKWAVTAVPQS